MYTASIRGRIILFVAACAATQLSLMAQVGSQNSAQIAQQANIATQTNADAAKANAAQRALTDGGAIKSSQTTATGARINTEKDLPHVRYPLHESASSLVAADNADFNSFLSHYSPDLNTLLAGLTIENKELLLRLLQTQEDAAILMGDRKAAESALEKRKDAETIPAERALLGLDDYAFLRAWKKAGAENGDAFQKAYADEYTHRVNALPWGTVGEQVKAMAAQCAHDQPAPQVEYVKVHLDPETLAAHAVMLSEADRIVLARKAVQFDQPMKAPRCAVLAAYVGSHTAQ